MEKEKYKDKDWLYEQYYEKELTVQEIAEKCNTSTGTISYWKGEILKTKKKGDNKNGEKICPVCGKRFKATGRQKTCSKSCGIILSRNNTDYDKRNNNNKSIEKICEYCGEKFIGPHNAKYCSEKCRLLSGTNPDYYSVFYRDHFRCRYCGRTPADDIRLTIDHIYPKSKGGKEHKFNLVTACQECNSHKGATLWSKKRIKEIWWQNKKLAQDASSKEYEEIVAEFKEDYPDLSVPELRGGY